MSSRERLVEATKQLLSEQGFEATSPREIQRRSGVGQGSFYHHFDSKTDLAAASLAALAADMIDEFETLAGDSPWPSYLRVERDALAGCRIGRLAMEASITDDRLRSPVETYFRRLEHRLGEHFAATHPDAVARDLATLVIAAVQGGFVVARSTGDADAQQRAVDALGALLEATMRTEGTSA